MEYINWVLFLGVVVGEFWDLDPDFEETGFLSFGVALHKERGSRVVGFKNQEKWVLVFARE